VKFILKGKPIIWRDAPSFGLPQEVKFSPHVITTHAYHWDKVDLQAVFGYNKPMPQSAAAREASPLVYFLHMFPKEFASSVIENTRSATGNQTPLLTMGTYFRFVGAILASALAGFKDIVNEAFAPSNDSLFAPRLRLNKFLSLTSFKRIKQSFSFVPPQAEGTWAGMRILAAAFTAHTTNVFTPSSIAVVDETMAGWEGHVNRSKHPKAMPSAYYIPSKPTQRGMEIRNVACGTSGMMYSVEIMEDAAGMAHLKYVGEMKASAAQVLRLMDNAHMLGKKALVVGDAAFGSLETAYELLKRDTYFVGAVKQGSLCYPMAHLKGKVIGAHAWLHMWHISDAGPICATLYGHVGNDTYISTGIMPDEVKPSPVRNRARQEVRCPGPVAAFYNHHNAVDVFNQYLEMMNFDGYRTHEGLMRAYMSLLGIPLVNSFCSYINDQFMHSVPRSRLRFQTARAFAQEIVLALLTNTLGGAPPPRGMHDADSDDDAKEEDEKEEDVAYECDCDIRALSKVFDKPLPRAVCHECKERCYTVCETCSPDPLNAATAVFLCGLETDDNRQCAKKHILAHTRPAAGANDGAAARAMG